MPSDASLPPNAPLTNGVTHDYSDSHGEADASHTTLAATCADLHARVTAFLCSPSTPKSLKYRTQSQVRISIAVTEKALQDYGFSQLSLSYNGGKDCLVLLIIYLSVLHSHFNKSLSSSPPSSLQPNQTTNTHLTNPPNPPPTFPKSIPSIYAKPPDPFPAVTSFVSSSSKSYHLNLTHIHTHTINTQPILNSPQTTYSFPAAFAHYLHSNPAIRAIFVGTRRTDPHGHNLTHFDPTDGNWPAFMRIHPVIDWHLSEIWCFLRADELRDPKSGERLEYCSMYDEGYTSLGGVGDTLRNPKLRYVDEKDGSVTYSPAHELTEDDEERLGRE